MTKSLSQRIALYLSGSLLLRAGKILHENHLTDWQLGGSFVRKSMANAYLILNDYGKGLFPPKLPPREETFKIEREQFESWEFQSLDKTVAEAMTKPFSFPLHLLKCYTWAYVSIIETFNRRGIKPGSKLLEFGCGMGWLAELLTYQGYHVTGTTIAPIDIKHAKRRIGLLKERGIQSKLDFFCSPMEEMHKHIDPTEPFDATFCFEALHHAFDWRESLDAAAKCIRPGGQLFLFSEPPTLHTFICYRSAKILKTHEIGFKRKELVSHLKSLGLTDIEVRQPVHIEKIRDFWKYFVPFTFGAGSLMARSFWIAARKK